MGKLNYYKVGFFILLGIFVFSFLIQDAKNSSTNNVISNSVKEAELRKTVEQGFQYAIDNNLEGAYSQLTPSDRKAMSFADYQKKADTRFIYSSNGTIHSIKVDGDRGIVDRTIDRCFSKTCQGMDKVHFRYKVEWTYINGKWYLPYRGSMILCEREQPYSMQPEFDRAVSLIIQRHRESKDDVNVSESYAYESMKNCLDIRYAPSDSQLNGAEGVFSFDKNSPKDRLQILVSPRYQAKDDLLTAILLVHEMTHAYFRAIDADGTISCFDNEARAFTNEVAFIAVLNAEELDSLNKRIYSTPDNTALNQMYNQIKSYKGESLDDKALQYVKNSPYYQKQCGLPN